MAARGSAWRRRLRHRLSRPGHLFRRTRCDQGIFSERDQRTPGRRHGRADRFGCRGSPCPRPQEIRRGSQAPVESLHADAPSQHRQRPLAVRNPRHGLHGHGFRGRRFALQAPARWTPVQRSQPQGAGDPDRPGARPRPPGRRAPPRHQAAQHPGHRRRPAGADRLRFRPLRIGRCDQHQGHLPHPALRGDRTVCEDLQAGPLDRRLRARRGAL